METSLVSARTIGTFCRVDGDLRGKIYKNVMSGFRVWDKMGLASEWVLFPQNLGTRDAFDVTVFGGEVYSFVSNLDAKGMKGSIVAISKGTWADDVCAILEKIPMEEREKVEDVTMDLAESMRGISVRAFPKAMVVIDLFHLIKDAVEAVEVTRMKA